MPIAYLHSSFANANRGPGERARKMQDFLLFKPANDDGHIDDLLMTEDW